MSIVILATNSVSLCGWTIILSTATFFLF